MKSASGNNNDNNNIITDPHRERGWGELTLTIWNMKYVCNAGNVILDEGVFQCRVSIVVEYIALAFLTLSNWPCYSTPRELWEKFTIFICRKRYRKSSSNNWRVQKSFYNLKKEKRLDFNKAKYTSRRRDRESDEGDLYGREYCYYMRIIYFKYFVFTNLYTLQAIDDIIFLFEKLQTIVSGL